MGHQSTMGKRLARLRSMSRGEIVDRVRQHVTARLDDYQYRHGHDLAAQWSGSASERKGNFFFAPSEIDGICELLKERFPSAAGGILASAEKVLRHRFDLLGYDNLDYGADIDWHLDLIHGKRGPQKPWYQVQYLDFVEVGDSKITWELNRHQHMVTLAKAFRLTGDERFAAEIAAQWKSWWAANPYPIGMNWASSLEVAFRCLSWIWTYVLLEGSSGMTPELRREWVRGLAVSGRHVDTYLSTYFSPNTHLLGEAVSLFFLGTLFPDFPAAARWKQRGWQVVVDSARKQVRPDGYYFEQATYYHVYALDFFLHTRILAAHNQVAIPADYDATLVRMLDALCLLGRAGLVPSVGDDDGGRVFDARRNRSEYLLDPLSTGAVLFERGDYKFVCGGAREETLWLTGAEGIATFEKLESAPPSDQSVALKDSGLFLMADAEIGQQMIVDAGPQGPGTAGHGHADALSLTLNSNGRSLLLDPGTLEYVGETQADRSKFRSTGTHNTMRVDGLEQAEEKGPFAWTALPTVRQERWISGQKIDLFAASHEGYRRLPDPVVHRRWVVHHKAEFWFVRDVALGKGRHTIEISWHLGPSMSPASARDYIFTDGQESLGLITAEGHGWSQSAHRGEWSPAYGRQERATVLTFGTVSALPVEFVTLLLPNASLHQIGRLERLSTDSGVSGYRYSREGDEHYLFFAEEGKPWTVGAWASDAQFLYWSSSRRTGAQLLVVAQGTYAEAAGKRILTCEGLVDYVEAVGSVGKSEMFSPDTERARLLMTLDQVEAELISAEHETKRIGV